MAMLQIVVPRLAKEFIQLSQGTIRIGRSEDSDIRLTTAASSKAHATIECFGSHCLVTDLRSRNGTLVNGIRLIQAHKLKDGDVLDFGGAKFVFLDTVMGSDESLGSTNSRPANPSKVLTPLPDSLDPERSIRRTIVRTGDVVSSHDLHQSRGIDGPRVLATINMHDLPLATWDMKDSTRKISYVIRLTESIIAFHDHGRINDVLHVLLELFPAASHAIIGIDDTSVDGLRIIAAVSRLDGDVVFFCYPLMHRSVTDGEGLLVTDHWRNDPNTRPKLSELNRQSLLCVPIPGPDQTCQGVIQLQANDPNRPFSEPDLQRLAVLSHVLGAALPGFRHPA
ncbi:MAG: FHA domain-containing protein [Fuerstia sp.]|nr:FHA domain-containing protein [Fuerstiella sp.]